MIILFDNHTYHNPIFNVLNNIHGRMGIKSKNFYYFHYRISLLVISVSCAGLTVCLTIYTRHHRRVKVFRVASPVFLSITLLGCAIMYMEVSYWLCQMVSYNFSLYKLVQLCCVMLYLYITLLIIRDKHIFSDGSYISCS